jgi:hypothetical protein
VHRAVDAGAYLNAHIILTISNMVHVKYGVTGILKLRKQDFTSRFEANNMDVRGKRKGNNCCRNKCLGSERSFASHGFVFRAKRSLGILTPF